jgi:predicted nuclease of predicted toxin-antitoxin system
LKLLFDENLSERLPLLLASLYPDSTHPRLCRLAGATDQTLRDYARENGYIMVSRDQDLADLARFYGAPPKVIWLRFHNPSSRVIANALRINFEQIEAFAASEQAFLILRQ